MNAASTPKLPAGSHQPEKPGFLDFKGIAEKIPLSDRSLRAAVRSGAIPSIVLPGGRKRLFHWPSVEAALRRHQTGGVQ